METALSLAWELLKFAADLILSLWGRRVEKAVEGK